MYNPKKNEPYFRNHERITAVSDEFGGGVGLRQGCVLSPLLFSLYINSLAVKLKNEACGVCCRGSVVPGFVVC